MEEVEKENVDAGEHPEQAALHDEEQHEVSLEPLRARTQRIEPGGEADDGREHEHRERNAVEAELQRDAESVETGRARAEELVARAGVGGKFLPEPERDQRREDERGAGEFERETLGQAARDDERRDERRGDGEQEKLSVGEHETSATGSGRKTADEHRYTQIAEI